MAERVVKKVCYDKDAGKKLFTPGPLCVSPTVRAALTRDLGSRDSEFIGIVKSVREELVNVAGLPLDTYTCVLMQGSGTFSIEAVLQSTTDRQKEVLIFASGAYGLRMGEICEKVGLPLKLIAFPEHAPVDVKAVKAILESGNASNVGSVGIIHCETTSGIVNPIGEIGDLVKTYCPGAFYIVDAMSSFGGIVTDFKNVDFIISSANKCIQGVPGLSFVIANVEKLQQCQGRSQSLCLDIYDQWLGLEATGQFRFTPPTHTILALNQALAELSMEGGVQARENRYIQNNVIIKRRLKELGFEVFVKEEEDGHIITSFKYPSHPNFNFQDFYDGLSQKGQLIYPGKVTNAPSFRIGNIGHLFAEDMEFLGDCVKAVLEEMKVPIPISSRMNV